MFLALALACAPATCPPGFVGDGVTCTFDEAALQDLLTHFDDGTLVKVNQEAYLPPYSSWPIRRNLWISDLPVEGSDLSTVELYASIDQDDWANPLPYAFPVGTVIVHEAVDREEPHGVEVKRDDYLDDWGRDWWMRMIDDDGVEEDEGMREPCLDCHNEIYRPSEGLWGVPAFTK